MDEPLGTIVTGSLCDGLIMRVNSVESIEKIRTGQFVSIVGREFKFFSLITDLSLATTNPELIASPPSDSETLFSNFVRRHCLYATIKLKPMLKLDTNQKSSVVNTIPPQFSPVYAASNSDVEMIFSKETTSPGKFFALGTPLGMDSSVCINLEKLVERSSGIFGKTGTGKTFLSKLIVAGIISRNAASCLIFDMHSEYGLQSRSEEESYSFCKGLKQLLPTETAVFSLDPASTKRRGGSPDHEIMIGYDEISVEDILSLQEELHLHPTAVEAASLIYAKHKNNWLRELLTRGQNVKEFSEEIGAHPESVAALLRKLRKIERLPFVQPEVIQSREQSSVQNIVGMLAKGISIVVEFGSFSSTFSYLLVANVLTRRIHALYVNKTEQFLGSRQTSTEPKKLVIVVEEAHKFLNPLAARQTIFATIAREMRKYYVSLMIIDQRPSGIDLEIMSQLGTKIVAKLSDERDIASVLAGTDTSLNLRGLIASLATKKQVLLLGHALPMPMVIHTREYGADFYSTLSKSVYSAVNIAQSAF